MSRSQIMVPTTVTGSVLHPADLVGSLSQAGAGPEYEDFLRRVRIVRIGIILITFMHALIATVVTLMATVQGTDNSGFFGTIVFCAIGCAITCLCSIVLTYFTFKGTNRLEGMPSWTWLNHKFMQSVGNMVAISIFALPGLVLHVLHAEDRQFMNLITDNIRSSRPKFIYVLLCLHLTSGVASFVADVALVIQTSKKLKSFQDNANHTDRKTLVRMGSRTGYLPLAGDAAPLVDDADDSDDIEVRPVARGDKTLAFFTFVSYTAFFLDINGVAIHDTSSGTIVCAVIMDLFYLYFLYASWYLKNAQTLPEHRFMDIRYFSIAHLFFLLFTFWVSLTSMVLLELSDQGFFTTLSKLDTRHLILSIILLISIFIVVVIYAGVLFLYSKLMWSLDEISSMFLAAKLQAQASTGVR